MACAEGTSSAEFAVSFTQVRNNPVRLFTTLRAREVLTNHEIRLGRGLLDNSRVVVRPIYKLHVGILGLYGTGPLLTAREKGVLIIRVLFLQGVEDIAAEVAFERCSSDRRWSCTVRAPSTRGLRGPYR